MQHTPLSPHLILIQSIVEPTFLHWAVRRSLILPSKPRGIAEAVRELRGDIIWFILLSQELQRSLVHP